MLDKRIILSTFDKYVSDYDASDPKIKLKIDHTYRVAALCERISSSIGADRQFSWLCGMLHDIGRFEQVRRYNTFSDALSVDHAQLGADLLFKDGLIKCFTTDLGEENMRILEKAIRNHSAYRLEDGLSKEETTYCNILRDADKIDIFRVNCDTPLEEIYNVSTENLSLSPISKEVRDCFNDRTAVLRSLKVHPADYVVGHICLVFELVYPISKEIVKEQGYLDKLLDFESDNPDTSEWFEHMNNTLRRAKII